MKYSNYLGIILIALLMGSSALPWVTVPDVHLVVRGFSGGANFGRPILGNMIFCAGAIACFLLRTVWAKRAGVFITAMNMAWSLKNFLILGMCREGDCPVRQFGLYAMLVLSIGIFVCSLLPDLPVAQE